LPTGGFDFERNTVVRGTPTQVYDMITGDIRPWWDHTFSEHPKALYVEPWPGGGFYEIFDDAGNGVKHATVTWRERGKRLSIRRPLGLDNGNAPVFVSNVRPVRAGRRTQTKGSTSRGASRARTRKVWAEGGGTGVWGHLKKKNREENFLDALRAYAASPKAPSARKPGLGLPGVDDRERVGG
jgi:hypothetical protein